MNLIEKKFKDIERGDIIRDKDGHERKVLEVWPSKETMVISLWYDFESASGSYTIAGVKAEGWKLYGEKKAWTPTVGQNCWFIDKRGAHPIMFKDDSFDREQIDTFGLYPDEASAQAAFERACKAAKGK